MIYEFAAVLCVDPTPFTLRELTTMAQHRAYVDWTHTAAILSTICNALGGDTTPSEFNPFAPPAKKEPKAPKGSIQALKVFLNG